MKQLALVVLLFAACAREARFVPAGPLELRANVDDDDGDAIRDGLDAHLNGPADAEDLLAVTLEAPCRDTFVLSVEPAEHLHVFADGALVRSGATLPCGRQVLLLEALRTRSGVWNGRATVIAAGARLELRVAPVIFPDVTKRPLEVFAVDVVDNAPLLAALRESGVPLTLARGGREHHERWLQDAVSAGWQGGQRLLLEMDRPLALEGFAASQLGRDVGLARPGRDAPTPLSFGGNLEVIPPHVGFPLGRLLVGGDDLRRMGDSTRAWLEAQEVQGPPLELPTSWLETGHIDELVAFVPSPDGGWTGFVASPRLALAHLPDAADVDVAFNERVGAQLDVLTQRFTQATGRALVPLPQLFAQNDAGLAVSLHASVVNLVSLGPSALVASSDLFEPLVRERLRAAGVEPRFVDGAAYHAHGGGLHCGVEVVRALK